MWLKRVGAAIPLGDESILPGDCVEIDPEEMDPLGPELLCATVERDVTVAGEQMTEGFFVDVPRVHFQTMEGWTSCGHR